MDKSIFASKVFWFNVGTALVAVGAGKFGFNLPVDWALGVNLVGNILLRFVTTQPVRLGL